MASDQGWQGAPTGAERLFEALYGEPRRGAVAGEHMLHEAANVIQQLRERLRRDDHPQWGNHQEEGWNG